ncbi:MAG TPA: hypothetical protein VNY05_20220 [Candidatus Acidoferrales bacterium]|nr:hypothetical protein [Candidatus Acidoferrales bacterium]
MPSSVAAKLSGGGHKPEQEYDEPFRIRTSNYCPNHPTGHRHPPS